MHFCFLEHLPCHDSIFPRHRDGSKIYRWACYTFPITVAYSFCYSLPAVVSVLVAEYLLQCCIIYDVYHTVLFVLGSDFLSTWQLLLSFRAPHLLLGGLRFISQLNSTGLINEWHNLILTFF